MINHGVELNVIHSAVGQGQGKRWDHSLFIGRPYRILVRVNKLVNQGYWVHSGALVVGPRAVIQLLGLWSKAVGTLLIDSVSFYLKYFSVLIFPIVSSDEEDIQRRFKPLTAVESSDQTTFDQREIITYEKPLRESSELTDIGQYLERVRSS